MTDLLDQGLAWLDEQRRRFMSQPVTYRRGIHSVEVSATRGRTLFEQADEFGRVIRAESQDFLVTAADLVLNGNPILPRAGDKILEDGRTFEVVAPGSEPVYRFSDPGRTTLRIHTKCVA